MKPGEVREEERDAAEHDDLECRKGNRYGRESVTSHNSRRFAAFPLTSSESVRRTKSGRSEKGSTIYKHGIGR